MGLVDASVGGEANPRIGKTPPGAEQPLQPLLTLFAGDDHPDGDPPVAGQAFDNDPADDDPDNFEPNTEWLCGTGAIEPVDEDDSNREAVGTWKFASLGGRPVDYIGRDLMLAPMLRDRRLKLFHEMTKEPAPWIEARVAHLPADQRLAAIQLTALDYLHRRQVARLYSGQGEMHEGFFENGHGHGLLMSLNACRPVGAQYTWAGPGNPARDYTCRYARLCPWCHARKVVALHDRLVTGPCSPERLADKCLVRVQFQLGGFRLASHPPFVRYAAERGYEKRSGLFRTMPGGADNLTAEAKLVRDYFTTRYFNPRREAWGLEGGLVTYQAEPFSDDREHPSCQIGFRHELNLIGTVSAARAKEIFRVHRGIRPYLDFDGRDDEPVLVELVRGTLGHAVRHVLAGTAYNYHPNWQDSWADNASDDDWVGDTWDNGVRRYDPAGVDGALRLMPWSLADATQWWGHQRATREMQLYSTFGSWRVQPPAARKLATIEASDARRAQLLAIAAPVFRRFGGKAGWRKLRSALVRVGHTISQRDAEWLSRTLKQRAE